MTHAPLVRWIDGDAESARFELTRPTSLEALILVDGPRWSNMPPPPTLQPGIYRIDWGTRRIIRDGEATKEI